MYRGALHISLSYSIKKGYLLTRQPFFGNNFYKKLEVLIYNKLDNGTSTGLYVQTLFR